MLSMRERAELIGGQPTVCSGIGQGTTIQLQLPLQ
jgi:signal transduction histidine kinase